METQTLPRLTADQFVSGLICGLALTGCRTLPFAGTRLDEIVSGLAAQLEEEADLRFRIRPHFIHGDSPTLRDALAGAAQAGLISYDGPDYRLIRLRIDAEDAAELTAHLPLPAGRFAELARELRAQLGG